MKTRRSILGAIILAFLIFIIAGHVYAENAVKQKTLQYDPPPPFAPDQVIVAFRPGTPGDARRSAHAQAGGRVIDRHAAINAELVSIPKGMVHKKIAVYKRNPNVRYAEPNYYLTLSVPGEGLDDFVCSGEYWDEQWYLHNTGQPLLDPSTGACSINGANDADIDWLEVWDSEVRGRDTIKIAVIDSGIEATHPDLANKISEVWVANQITEGPGDLIGHGTHVAGIAAAETNNGTGISGVGISTMVGSLKGCYYSFLYGGICQDWDTEEAIRHAADNGYHIINMSFGGPTVSQGFKEAVQYAFNKGVILVSSAGNEYSFEKPTQSYPAALPGVVSVAATDYYDNLPSFSNFGQWVDIAAPGVNILSTYPEAGCADPDCYNWMSGTSMASPVVAGAAALVLDKLVGVDSILDSDEFRLRYRDAVISTLLDNADHTGALGQNMLVWTKHGRLNLYAALTDTGSYCGDGTCDPGEDSCNCLDDCGPPTVEICNDGTDNDCDGLVDCDDSDCINASACPTCEDSDFDDYTIGGGCGRDVDCDDNNPNVNPGATEVCEDGIDNDCDGEDSPCCLPKKATCVSDADCCSGDCLPKGSCR